MNYLGFMDNGLAVACYWVEDCNSSVRFAFRTFMQKVANQIATSG